MGTLPLGKIVNGDCLEVMKTFSDNSIDAVVSDPPYGISFMGKDWDKALPTVATWKECLRVLKPGGFAFIMASARQDVLSHMIINLETAGFATGFTSIYWCYSTGFPKAINIAKAVDKRFGAEREVVGEGYSMPKMPAGDCIGGRMQGVDRDTAKITKDATPEAIELSGAYGGFQPKPAVEVVIVVMKPLDEKTYIDQALKNKKGVTWLDDCRIPFKKHDTPMGGYGAMDIGIGKPLEHQNYEKKTDRQPRDNAGVSPLGRFPANLLVSDDALNDGVERSYGKSNKPYSYVGNVYAVDGFIKSNSPQAPSNYGDGGSYSRYFSLDAWWEKQVEKLPESVRKVFPFLIVAKASKSEKDVGCAGRDIPEYRWNKGGISQQIIGTKGNSHPSVKPLKLMNYLITLSTRRGDVVLDPFAGSGTTCISAEMLDRKWIGVEMNKEYIEIANARLESLTNAKQDKLFEEDIL